MRECLVIVDMQPGFECSNPQWVIDNVCGRVRQAKARGAGIVVVEYSGPYLTTHDEIMSAIGDYADCVRLVKHNDDGGVDVHRVIERKWGEGVARVFVCGVNLQYCVKETAITLLTWYRVVLLREACNGPYDGYWDTPPQRSIDYMSRNGIIVSTLDTDLEAEYN